MHTKQQILDFMADQELMVISTLNDGSPQSAVVGFANNEDFEIIFGTLEDTRKVQNIQNNEAVSVVIGWQHKVGTVQLEGTARMLEPNEIDTLGERYFAKNPNARKRRHNDNERYFIITPTWLRYNDVSSYPWDYTEFTF